MFRLTIAALLMVAMVLSGCSSPKEYATVDLSHIDGVLIPGHSWHAFALCEPSGDFESQCYAWAEDNPQRLQYEVETSGVALIPDGAVVELGGQSNVAGAYYKIYYEDKGWYMLGAWLLDEQGQRVQ